MDNYRYTLMFDQYEFDFSKKFWVRIGRNYHHIAKIYKNKIRLYGYLAKDDNRLNIYDSGFIELSENDLRKFIKIMVLNRD